ncbi:TolC family outer membrane protein [Micavibrio aeruginosavorus]|uniref:Type I secretion outer membrane, TolC family protein n=1 Tax=Micavibrio aeruginosavorus (strain ARL-13) TaxID=856793 RepID=G2KPI0_MICAA|nr:TolC family outer membrane protein [Micavibrio aeruginosavorus]AEP09480.1 type I secretion outer membrane, TolC family protein [Micavibrio aeruginosavorus ARL-13]
MIRNRNKFLTGVMALMVATPLAAASAQDYTPKPGVGMAPIMDGPGERSSAGSKPQPVIQKATSANDAYMGGAAAPGTVSKDSSSDMPKASNGEDLSRVAAAQAEKAEDMDINIHTIQTADGKAPEQTLGAVLRWAYDNNPTIRAARQELYATQENLPQAQAGWKPTASANANVTKTWLDGTGDPDGSTEKGIGAEVQQPLYRGGRTVASTDSAENLILAQRAFLKATEQDVMISVITAYMNVLRDQALYDLSVNNREVIARQLEASRARFDVGDVTRTDVSQSEARLAQAEAGVTNAIGQLRSSLAVYEQVVGMPAGRLVYPKVKVSIPASRDAAVSQAETDNPSVVAAEFLRNAAEHDIDRVFGELLPEVGLFAQWNQAWDPSPGLYDDSSDTAIGVRATIPLYEAGATRSRVRQAKHTESQRLLQISEARRLARQQAVSSWEDLAAARAEITSREAQVVATRVARDGVKQEAELGTRTILDALDADQEYLDAQTALVTAQRDEVVAQYFLASTVGTLTPDSLGFPELSHMEGYDAHLDDITSRVFSMDTENTVDHGDNGL